MYDSHSYLYLNLRILLRITLIGVTFAVNSAQATLHHIGVPA